jgi:methionine-gamma-lyase
MKNKNTAPVSIATICAQDDVAASKIKPHIQPLYASSTYIYESPEEAAKIFEGKEQGFIYGRWSHPNAETAEKKIEQLETFGLKTAAKALMFSSGMAALNALFQSLLQPGDVLIAQGNIYGTSIDYFNYFGSTQRVKIIYADFKKLPELEQQLKAEKGKVKLLYCETPSNPTINCYNLKALSALAKKHHTKLAVDNTFASPLLQQPFSFGVDFVLHSTTKFLNGHGNALGGVLLGSDVSFMQEKVWKVRKLHGSIVAPFDAWLLNNGIKTLPLRLKQHCLNAQQIAEYLHKHKAVNKVNYLGLKTHEDYTLASQQMKGFGGVLSFELKNGIKAGRKLMKQVRLCKLTASLGTSDTLIQHPASMSHSFVPKKQRDMFGITDGLVRLSVGLEDANDIIADLAQALK